MQILVPHLEQLQVLMLLEAAGVAEAESSEWEGLGVREERVQRKEVEEAALAGRLERMSWGGEAGGGGGAGGGVGGEEWGGGGGGAGPEGLRKPKGGGLFGLGPPSPGS